METEKNQEISIRPLEKRNSHFYQKVFGFLGYNPELPESIEKEEMSMWVPDNLAQTCYKCHKQFSLFMRKHHCRICGNVFCKDCSQKMVEGKYWGCQKEIKVCEYCYKMYKKLDETLVDTIIENKKNIVEDISSIDDNIKNLKRETKLSEYCKKAKKENEESYKFLMFKDKIKEEQVKSNIEACYNTIVRGYIETVLKNDLQNPNLFDNWYEKIIQIVNKVMNRISPSCRDLNDSMNINDYIKIKTIKYKNKSLCRLIDGIALRKNVSSKKMRTNLENPKILLLDCGLDSNRNTEPLAGSINFDILNSQEPAYLENIQKKIKMLEVNLILMNKNKAHQLQQDFLRNNKIILVLNVKSKALKQIARCTKTYVIPSIDLIDKQTIFGHCKKFKIEKMQLRDEIITNNNDLIKSKEYNLMIFEGCDNLLFQTIILSGPDVNELKALKTLLKFSILLTVRDFYLQKSVLYFLYCSIPKSLSVSNNNNTIVNTSTNPKILTVASIAGIKLDNSPIGLSQENRSSEISLKCSQSSGPSKFFFSRKTNSSNEDTTYKYGFDTQSLFENITEILFVKLRMCRGIKKTNELQTNVFGFMETLSPESKAAQSFFPNKENSINTSSAEPNSTPKTQILPQSQINKAEPDCRETEVLKMINFNCGESEEIKLIFYASEEKYDKPLGKLIIDMCSEKDQKCDKCKRLKSNHFYYLYSSNCSRIKITFILNNTDCKLDKVLEYINRERSTEFSKYNNFTTSNSIKNSKIDYTLDMFSYGYCRICKEIVTPLCKVPRDLFNYSSSKFFKHILFNHELKNRNDKVDFNLSNYFAKNNCGHSSFKSLDRIFVTKIGTIMISYENFIKYYIDTKFVLSPDFMTKDTMDPFVTGGQEQCNEVLDAINANFIYANEEFTSLKNLIKEKKIQNNSFISIIDKELKEMTKLIALLLEQKSLVALVFNQKYNSYSKCLVYVKRLYFRICQLKVIQNKTRRAIQKLKYFIALELYLVIDNLKISEQDLSNIPQFLQTVYNKYLPLFSVVNYINLDNKPAYMSILETINYYDEKHVNFTSEIKEKDLSSIIAYTLTSDKYRNHVHQLSKCRLLDIKCERKLKLNLNNTVNTNENFFSKEPNQHPSVSNNENTNDNKFTYNYFTFPNQNETVLFDTMLLYDSSKNSYMNLDSTKINQQLETELLSDEKSHFFYSTRNINSKTFKFGTRSRKVTISSKQTMSVSSPKIEKSKYEAVEEKLNALEDEIQIFFDNISGITIEFKEIKNSYNFDIKFNTLSFIEDTISDSECEVVVYYPRQFEALRIAYCSTFDELIASITKSKIWADVSGGKSKASFFKSADNKYLFKSVNKNEFKMFIEAACPYFHHNAKYLFHRMPSALSKMLGAFKIKIKRTINNQAQSDYYYLILMENLFYGFENEQKSIKAYDLKGSLINRYIPKKNQKPNQVLLDTNFKEDFNGEPLALDRNIFELLSSAIHNDSLILSKINVIDYSLLVIISDIGESDMKLLRVGIIDYIRKYTWDKQLEHVGKIIINGLNTPTIISPNDYRDRFKAAAAMYFIGV